MATATAAEQTVGATWAGVYQTVPPNATSDALGCTLEPIFFAFGGGLSSCFALVSDAEPPVFAYTQAVIADAQPALSVAGNAEQAVGATWANLYQTTAPKTTSDALVCTVGAAGIVLGGDTSGCWAMPGDGQQEALGHVGGAEQTAQAYVSGVEQAALSNANDAEQMAGPYTSAALSTVGSGEQTLQDSVNGVVQATNGVVQATQSNVNSAVQAVQNTGLLTPPAGPTAFAYNAADQTIAAATAHGAETYIYRGAGQSERVWAGPAGAAAPATTFTNTLLGLTSQTHGKVSSYFLRDPDGGLLGFVASSADAYNTVYYHLTDALGSVVGLTNRSAPLVARYDYDPYGKLTQVWTRAKTITGDSLNEYTSGYYLQAPVDSPSSAGQEVVTDDAIARANPYRFAGAYQDPTGLYHMGERYYDPSVGRFTQQDPVHNPLDPKLWNPYTYVGDDPVNFLDPSGLHWWGKAWRAVCGPFRDTETGLSRGQKFAAGAGIVGATAGLEALTSYIASTTPGFVATAAGFVVEVVVFVPIVVAGLVALC